ncbi:TetR/AcrR family transcriptional regulator [Algivirga pacifica]|uniref:TetR/AcrR family transcriptional regulator n=1 Tax=Algivirga pacifica TaxID=1162670 RepID=A0ABP9D9V8_9BACT
MDTKKRIEEVAESLFMRYGLRAVTMDDIASELGMSKKTIYQFYKDKKSLVEEVMLVKIQEEEQVIERIMEDSSNAIENFVKVSDYLKKVLATINPVVFWDVEKYYPEAWKHYCQNKEKHCKVFQEILEQGIREGLFRPEINTNIIARLRLQMVDMGFNQDIYPSSEFNLVEVQSQFIEHFIRGVVTEKGMELLQRYQEQELIGPRH